MAKITDGTFRTWNDTEVVTAAEYTREREILKVATNDNDERLSNLESSTIGLELGTLQTSKITDNEGGVKISVRDTSQSIIEEVMRAGKGLHTFYAISGSRHLPPAGISIRGTAHITGVDPIYGYFTAIDYKNNMYISYIDNGVWSEWDSIVSYKVNRLAGDLNNMLEHGDYYVNPGTANAPSTNAGNLFVKKLSSSTSAMSQVFMDLETGVISTRVRGNTSWEAWSKLVSSSDIQEQLWVSTAGYYMHDGQTVTPTKKLSQCRNGWILVWSDYLSADAGAQNYNFSYSYIPKFIATKHNGAEHLCSVPSSSGGNHIVKSINIFDNKIEGTSGNEVGDDADVVLRYVLEW